LKSFLGDAERYWMFFDGGVLPGVVGRVGTGVICFEGVTSFFTGVNACFVADRGVVGGASPKDGFALDLVLREAAGLAGGAMDVSDFLAGIFEADSFPTCS
jgi:hypothetical protein